jgi:glucan phosphoethanolaminetransferase (alkaline phosphatase superfamily)
MRTLSSSATTSARAQTAIAAAGAVYVLAWIAGLLMAPAAPDPAASDAVVNSFFAENQAATLLQALTVHGVAGIALAVLVLSLARYLAGGRDDGTRTVFLVTGLGAAAVSLAQLAIEIALNRHVAGSGSASTTASLFHAINVADTVKLALLGIAIAAATRLAARAAAFPRWLRPLGYVLASVLIIGGLAFIVDSDALTGLLTAALFLLLFWTGAVSVVSARHLGRQTGRAALADH